MGDPEGAPPRRRPRGRLSGGGAYPARAGGGGGTCPRGPCARGPGADARGHRAFCRGGGGRAGGAGDLRRLRAEHRAADGDGLPAEGALRRGHPRLRSGSGPAAARDGQRPAVSPRRVQEMTEGQGPMKYTEDHEWLRVEGDLVVVGITEHAAEQLGDVVFVELPEVETKVARGDEVCVIESVKAASDILAPLEGEIVEVNPKVEANPSLVNEDATGEAWFFKMRIDDLAALDEFMSEDEYKDMIG